jgi:hypothetical protein
MAKIFHCSECGARLDSARKVLKNKQVILNLIIPHDCSDEFIENITDADEPVNVVKMDLAETEKKVAAAHFPNIEPGDRRDKDKVKSTAPANLLDQVKSGIASTPERSFNDLDGE